MGLSCEVLQSADLTVLVTMTYEINITQQSTILAQITYEACMLSASMITTRNHGENKLYRGMSCSSINTFAWSNEARVKQGETHSDGTDRRV